MSKKLESGYSLVEMIVVFTIIGILLAIVLPNIYQVKSKSRDAQVRSDIGRLKFALIKAKEANTNYIYPGATGWQCIKSSGTCWKGSYSGNTTIANAITPYLPGGTIPQPPGTKSTENRHDAYVINPNLSQASALPGNVYGPILVWYQEKPISDCNGYTTTYESGIYYCYEKLPQ